MENISNTISSTERNCSIDIFRIICAVMVVAIHTLPFYDVNHTAGYIATQIIPRIAVPFFLFVSGFYYIKSLLSKKSVFKKTIKRLLLVYVIWSFVYFFMDFLTMVMKQHSSIGTFIKHCILNFFIMGSAYQLWFFPVLFLCIFVVTIMNKMKLLNFLAYFSIALYILAVLGSSYYSIGHKIPIISLLIDSSWFTVIRRSILSGLPFFMLGYFFNMFQGRFKDRSNKNLLAIYGIILLLFLSEITLVIQFKLEVNIICTLFLYPLLAITMIILFKNSLPKKRVLSYYTRGIANFIFYSHPLFIMVIFIFGQKLANIKIAGTLMFLLTSVFATIVGLILMRINNRYVNKIFL